MNGYAYSNFEIGIILSISWISVFIAGPFVPPLLMRVGHKYILLTSFIFLIVSIGLLLVFVNMVMLTISSLLMGCGLILRWISCDTVLVEVTESSSTGRLIGIHEALMGLGIALGPLFFIYLDITAVAWVCLVLAAGGQLCFQFTRIPGAAAGSKQTGTGGVWSVCRIIALALAAAFVAGFIESSSIALLPLHFENFGYPLAESALLVSAFGFGGTLLQPPLGYLSDRKGYAFAQLLCLAGVCAGCVVIVALPMSFITMLAVLFVVGGAAGGLNTLAVIEAGKTLTQSAMAPAMTAIAMLYTLGGVSGPVTAGAALSTLNNSGMIVLFAAISALLAIYLIAKKQGG